MSWSHPWKLGVTEASLYGAGPAVAAKAVPDLDGSTLSLWWVLPFVGLLLSIALLPQFLPRFWHRHFGKVATGWALLFLVPFAAFHGIGLTLVEVLHTALLEYLPFVILLFAFVRRLGGHTQFGVTRSAHRASTRGCSRSAPCLRA